MTSGPAHLLCAAAATALTVLLARALHSHGLPHDLTLYATAAHWIATFALLGHLAGGPGGEQP